MKFVPAGPPRYAHQKRALRRIIETRGVCALLCDPGCIAGDAEVQINRAGKSFPITMADLATMWEGGKRSGHGWDPSITTRIQFRADDGTMRLTDLVRVLRSGVKKTYEVSTDTGLHIRATADHPFLTTTGWQRLDELAPGSEVIVRGQQSSGRSRAAKPRYAEVAGLPQHPYVTKTRHRHSPNRVGLHRLTAEASASGLGVADFIERIRDGRLDGLTFLNPAVLAVHHRDHDPSNNDPANLEVLTHEEHHRLHAAEGKTRSVLYKDAVARVVAIAPYGEEETYDLEVADDAHNFVANGFVVHNTGKTAITLDYMGLLTLANAQQNKREETRVLVLCPLVAVDTWVYQATEYLTPQISFWSEVLGGSIQQKAEALIDRKAGGTLHARRSPARSNSTGKPMLTYKPEQLEGPRLVMEVLNLDSLSRRDRVTSSKTLADVMVNAIKRFDPDLIVVDESHRIKGVTSNVSRLLARVSEMVPRRIILTGTVMPHSPLDVFGQWRFLAPTAFGKLEGGTRKRATFGAFKARYAVTGGYMGYQVTGFQNLDEMQEIMAQNAIVVKKEDALDLPKTTDVTVPVNLSAKEAKAYAEMRDQLSAQITDLISLPATNRLTQMLRLQQITSGHLPDPTTGQTHVIGTSRVDAAKSLVHDTLTGEKRIVIFAYFTQEIADLTKAIQAKGTEVLTVTGSTSQKDRMAIRARFGSEDPARLVLIAQIGTMSLAVNELVTASHAIFTSMSRKRDEYVQARDRLDRIGQTKPVTFWHLVAPATVDEVILKAHRDRTNLETAMLQHIKEG